MGRIVAAVAGAAIMSAVPAYGEPVKCSIKSKFCCSAERGCSKLPASVWSLIDRTALAYSRCDRAGCDAYRATFTHAGIYTTIDIAGRGLVAKLADTGEFTEIATLGNTAYISFGYCGR